MSRELPAKPSLESIRKRTEWWASGFGVLDDCDPSLVDFLIERDAVLEVLA